MPDEHLRQRARRLAARREHGLRRVRQPQERRLQAVPAQEHRPRQDLDVDRRRPAGARHGATRSPRTTSTRTCCSPAPSSACSSRSTAARSGSGSRAACRRSRAATSRSRSARTTSSSARSAAASTSSTTTRRCGSSTPETLREGRRRSSRSRDALLYIPTRQFGGARQGVPGRDVLHRRQPAVRRGLHLLPEGRRSRRASRSGRTPRRRRRRPASRRRTRRRTSCGPRPRRRRRRSLVTVTDADGAVVRTLIGPHVGAGLHRVTWDFRAAGPRPTSRRRRPAVTPGTYRATLGRRAWGASSRRSAGPSNSSCCRTRSSGCRPRTTRRSRHTTRRSGRCNGRRRPQTLTATEQLTTRLEQTKAALDQGDPARGDGDPQEGPRPDRGLVKGASQRVLTGDSGGPDEEHTGVALRPHPECRLRDRQRAGPADGTQRQSYEDAGKQLREELAKLRQIQDKDLPELEKQLDAPAPRRPRASSRCGTGSERVVSVFLPSGERAGVRGRAFLRRVVVPLTPGPSPPRGEGGRASSLHQRHPPGHVEPGVRVALHVRRRRVVRLPARLDQPEQVGRPQRTPAHGRTAGRSAALAPAPSSPRGRPGGPRRRTRARRRCPGPSRTSAPHRRARRPAGPPPGRSSPPASASSARSSFADDSSTSVTSSLGNRFVRNAVACSIIGAAR